MKKIASFLLAFAIVASLAACGQEEKSKYGTTSDATSKVQTSKPSSSSSGNQTPVDDSSSVPEPVVDTNPYPGQTAMGGKDLSLVMYSRDGTEPPTITLTQQQQNGIAQKLQSVIALYSAGDYPKAATEEDPEPLFATGWPNDVEFPKSAPVKQFIFITVGQEVYPMTVQMPLSNGWYMECMLQVVANEGDDIQYDSPDTEWVPVDAFFIDPNGLVFDQPGESVNEGGTVTVMS